MFKITLNKFAPYIIIGLMCFAVWSSHKEIERHREKSESLENTITNLTQEIKHTKIRLNDSIEVYQAEVKGLKMTNNNIQAKYDKLLKSISLKPKDVNNVTEITTIVHSVDTVPVYIDTFGGVVAELADPFININVEITPDKLAVFDYLVKDSLTVISVQKQHKWLFGLIKWKEQKSLRVINNNPNAEIVSLTTIDVIE